MYNRASFPLASLLILAILVVAVGMGVVAVMRIDSWGEHGTGLSPRFTYDLEPYQKTDPSLVRYKEGGRIALSIKEPEAVAVGPDDQIYVAGDRVVQVFNSSGERQREIALESEPRCLAVGGPHHEMPGRVYVGMKSHVEIYDAQGQRLATWERPSVKALYTSIAVDEKDVYVANAGDRIVLRYDTSGKLLGKIGAKDEAVDFRGFVIPSPYFDIAMAPDGLLRAVNPGAHSILAFTPEGHMEVRWGKASLADIRGFCGCCNPAAMTVLPDGRVITAEKGIPRVKVYTAEGEFDSVVAGPEAFLPTPTAAGETRTEHKLKVLDVAGDSRGRVLVLDPMTRSVRTFERITP
jgi:sugar lactone lactonase YvrE